MSKRRKRKPSVLRHKFTVGMQKKLVMLFIAILLAFVILVGRITYINASSGEDYTKTVLDQQQYMSQSIPFKRGDIVDTNGTKLATSERVYNVILDAKVLLSDETKKAEFRKKEFPTMMRRHLKRQRRKIPRSKESGWKRIMSENIHIIHLPAMSWDSAYRGMWEQADWKHPIIQR